MDRHKLEQLQIKVSELLRYGSPNCVRQAHYIMGNEFENVLSFALDLTEPKPKPKHTIADNYPAGGLTATEPCMFCKDFHDLEEKHSDLILMLQKALHGGETTVSKQLIFQAIKSVEKQK